MHLQLFIFFLIPPTFGYICTKEVVELSPPKSLQQPVYWPSDWDDSRPAEQFSANNSDCNWVVKIPQGLYATVTFYKNTPEDVSIYVLYTSTQADKVNNDDRQPFIFASQKSQVTLFKTNSTGTFSFKVSWSTYPNAIPNNVQLVPDKAIAQLPNAYLTTFTAKLQQSVVFDGDSTNSTFLGNLYILMMKNKAVVSSGKSLTVYTFGLDKVFDYPLYMAQDHLNDQNLFSYNGYNCNGTCKITLNSVFGPSAAVTVGSQPDFIKSLPSFPQNATLKIYEGTISEANLVTTLTKNNSHYRLPICTKNTLRHYVLDSQIVEVEISKDEKVAKWGKLYDGRKGFIHSEFHGTDSFDQNTDETFTSYSPEKLYFNYIVRDADFTAYNSKLMVLAYKDGQLVLNVVYDSTNIPPTSTVSILGDTFRIKYSISGYSKGFRIDFSSTSIGYGTNSSTTSVPIPVFQSSSSTTTTKTIGSTVTRWNSVETTTSYSTPCFSFLMGVLVMVLQFLK